MFRKIYRMKRLVRLATSPTVLIIAACLVAYVGAMQNAAAGGITERDALMFSTGVWMMGVFFLALRFAKWISRRW